MYSIGGWFAIKQLERIDEECVGVCLWGDILVHIVLCEIPLGNYNYKSFVNCTMLMFHPERVAQLLLTQLCYKKTPSFKQITCSLHWLCIFNRQRSINLRTSLDGVLICSSHSLPIPDPQHTEKRNAGLLPCEFIITSKPLVSMLFRFFWAAELSSWALIV